MKCKCQFENEESAKFCNYCGHRLELLCPECVKSNKHDDRFCNACGHRLEDIPTTVALLKNHAFGAENKIN